LSDDAKRAIFLDRDGTIIVDRGYSVDASAFEFLPGALEGLKRLHEAGYLLIIITNQSGVARGYFDEASLWLYNAEFAVSMRKQGVAISATYYCPHYAEGAVPSYTRLCSCRKPEPGMILKAAKELNIDLRASWMIGDSPADTGAGRAAGCRTIRIGLSGSDEPPANFDAPDLSMAADIILKNG
jgi:D-glycero-D-manno-heptose 1,7-bisphosphate phosphatase